LNSALEIVSKMLRGAYTTGTPANIGLIWNIIAEEEEEEEEAKEEEEEAEEEEEEEEEEEDEDEVEEEEEERRGLEGECVARRRAARISRK
jgi:hypothetical protein